MENTKDKNKNTYNNSNNGNIMLVKKIMVYLVTFTILLVFFSLYAIQDIRDLQVIKDTQTANIVYPDNPNDPDNPDNPDNPNNNQNNKNNTNNDVVPVVDNTDRFKIYEGDKEWRELKELNIFSGSYSNHVADNRIAPGVSGTYNFTVENQCDYVMKYDLNFSANNPYNVNLKFKMKLNGKYVVGDESTWKDGEDLTQKDRFISIHSNDIYTIEWKWIDAPNDTEVGETDGAVYTLKVQAYAEQQ